MRRIYLDNNATTRTDPRVVEAMLPFLAGTFGNPSSAHSFGRDAEEAVHAARQRVQHLLGAASAQEIVFTASGTEADNTVLLSALEGGGERDEIVTTAVEHPAVLACCLWLQKTRGLKLHIVPVDANGQLDRDAYRAALGARTAVVSVMWANNETGTIFPVAELAEEAHAAGALFHTDAVQVAGKLSIDLQATAIDFLSLSGHKFHAPKGVGVLYARRGTRLSPLLRGGKQERGKRASTENVPGIVGLARAVDLSADALTEEQGRVRALRDQLEQQILARVPGARVLGDIENRLPNTSCIAFEQVESEAVLTLLDRAGIACSGGSACASGAIEPSHVLRAMRVPFAVIHGAIRLSFSRDNDAADVDRVVEVLPGIIETLRRTPASASRLRRRLVA
jgi:cysteine desulfurase